MKIIVVGGGASGIMAALEAAKNGAEVTVLEHNPRIGKKLLATGNGRCNYTNILLGPDDYNHPDFVHYALKTFTPQDTIDCFRTLGIEPKYEEEGKTFPLSEQASSFLDVALYALEHSGVKLVTEAYVQSIIRTKSGFSIVLADGTRYESDRVILATGGKAMPKSGSEGSGYALAESLGHKITQVFPALTKLKLDSPYLKQLDGVKFAGEVELIVDNSSLQIEKGDILFTKYGISGPAVLQLSRLANDLSSRGEKIELKVRIITGIDPDRIAMRLRQDPDKPIDFALVGIANKRLIPAILKEAGIPKQNAPVATLSDADISTITALFFDWRFLVKGSMGFDDAQVTAGGVFTEEIDPYTMESKLVSGLFFAGELVDIDGRCGGYNLQWAWSSGYLAGKSAARG